MFFPLLPRVCFSSSLESFLLHHLSVHQVSIQSDWNRNLLDPSLSSPYGLLRYGLGAHLRIKITCLFLLLPSSTSYLLLFVSPIFPSTSSLFHLNCQFSQTGIALFFTFFSIVPLGHCGQGACSFEARSRVYAIFFPLLLLLRSCFFCLLNLFSSTQPFSSTQSNTIKLELRFFYFCTPSIYHLLVTVV